MSKGSRLSIIVNPNVRHSVSHGQRTLFELSGVITVKEFDAAKNAIFKYRDLKAIFEESVTKKNAALRRTKRTKSIIEALNYFTQKCPSKATLDENSELVGILTEWSQLGKRVTKFKKSLSATLQSTSSQESVVEITQSLHECSTTSSKTSNEIVDLDASIVEVPPVQFASREDELKFYQIIDITKEVKNKWKAHYRKVKGRKTEYEELRETTRALLQKKMKDVNVAAITLIEEYLHVNSCTKTKKPKSHESEMIPQKLKYKQSTQKLLSKLIFRKPLRDQLNSTTSLSEVTRILKPLK